MKMKKKKNTIENLEVFSESTLKMLLSRANYVSDILHQVVSFRKILSDINLVSTMSDYGIGIENFSQNHTKFASVLYRSLFQSAVWENEYRHYKITLKAYEFEEKDSIEHEKICKYTNYVLCHQDLVSASKSKYRSLYSGEYTKNDGSVFSVAYSQIFHIDVFDPLLIKIKKAISDAYLKKTGNPIPEINGC